MAHTHQKFFDFTEKRLHIHKQKENAKIRETYREKEKKLGPKTDNNINLFPCTN